LNFYHGFTGLCSREVSTPWNKKTAPLKPSDITSVQSGQRSVSATGIYQWICVSCRHERSEEISEARNIGHDLQPKRQKQIAKAKENAEFGLTIVIFLIAAIGMAIFILLCMHTGSSDN